MARGGYGHDTSQNKTTDTMILGSFSKRKAASSSRLQAQARIRTIEGRDAALSK
jgi:hypothetical protein